jgi:hypothetical protein
MHCSFDMCENKFLWKGINLNVTLSVVFFIVFIVFNVFNDL